MSHRLQVVVTIVLEVLSLLWHIGSIILYFVSPANDANLPITDAM